MKCEIRLIDRPAEKPVGAGEAASSSSLGISEKRMIG
jgi:hypothetical protein